jgi:hypothetical protein
VFFSGHQLTLTTYVAYFAYGLKTIRYFSPPPTLLSIFLGPGLLPRNRFVCPCADDHKVVIFVACQSDIYFQFLENLKNKVTEMLKWIPQDVKKIQQYSVAVAIYHLLY